MQQQVVWQGKGMITFDVVGEWPQPVTVTARPIITNYWFGTTVGAFYRGAWDFGHWYSSNVCDLITAWRVAQILPRIKTMRNRSNGYDATLCGLVIAMNGDRHENRMRERAKDLGMTVEELDAELKRLNSTWPNAATLYSMWVRLPESGQNEVTSSVRQAITDGLVDHHRGLEACVEQAEIRLRSAADQKQHEEELIAKGLDDKPYESFRMLMFDLGVTNLDFTVGCGDLGEPSHFCMQDLDRSMMRELIGKHGWSDRVRLITTAKGPDDKSAHWSVGGGGIVICGSNYGKATPPKVIFGSKVMDLVFVRYDRVTERFQLAVRPVGVTNSDEDVWMTIEQLREEISRGCGLDEPFEPGTSAPWLRTTNYSVAAFTEDQPRKWSKAWFGGLLHNS